MCVIDWNDHKGKWKHLREINFPSHGKRPIVDMLLGLDYANLHYSIRDVCGKANEPIARLTPLGWTCIGNPDPSIPMPSSTHLNRTYFAREKDPDSILRKFWEVENEGLERNNEQVNLKDQAVIEKCKSSMKFRTEDGHYEVAIPWKDDATDLPNDYVMAKKRLENTERKLMKNPKIANAYRETIEKYVEKGYVRRVPEDENPPGKQWFLPHFPVVKPDRATTKTRIVFDASAKYDNISLNDTIHQGPKLQRDLFDVLLRFRRHQIAIACDIAEMYLRINVSQEDRPYQRFLWRNLDVAKDPDIYEFRSVVFGMNSSPFLAQLVTREHAKLYSPEYPLAAETVLKSTYMDDSLDSVQNESEGIELYSQLSKLWEKAGMHARKWLSNSPTVLQNIPEQDRASEVDLDGGYLPSVKTLGVIWQSETDEFTFKALGGCDTKHSKRSFLSKIAMLFDPLGFLTPFTVRAKTLLQETWKLGLDWDEELPDELSRDAILWFRELEELNDVRIPRCIRITHKNKVISEELHTFVDASQDAYGAVTYARYTYEDGSVSTRLIAAKSRVAPLKATSILRLELMGAILGLRLSLSIVRAMEVDGCSVTYWSDSMNVLWWIRGSSRNFKTFVANRIGEIHDSTEPKQWRYVPTRQNPADLVSRGANVRNLTVNTLWWNGPDFLMEHESDWPENRFEMSDAAKLEIKKGNRTNRPKNPLNELPLTSICSIQCREQIIKPREYSNWMRLKRIRAWIYRFINNCRLSKNMRNKSELQACEIEDAEINILKETQSDAFPEEYIAIAHEKEIPKHSKLTNLLPRMDEHGLIRCDGRLQYAEFLPYDVRYPIVLPRKNWVTKLIVKHYHESGKHIAGTNQTLASISARFWIVSAREEIR